MSDTIEKMAEEFKIAYPLTYDAIYNKGKADKDKELSELPNQYSEKLWKNAYDRGYQKGFQDGVDDTTIRIDVLKADAIDEFIDKFIKRNQFKQMNRCECINDMYVLAEQLKEQNK